MAIIRCGNDENGSLGPLTVEFEPGDVIQLEGNGQAKFIAVERSFTLEGMSEYFQRLQTWLDTSGSVVVPGRHEHPDPLLPAPPPEDGAFTLKPGRASHNAITLMINE